MKKLLTTLAFLSFVICISIAQTTVEITADITVNTSWTSNNVYVLKGKNFLYVTNNATLTIEPGTVIKGDPAALVITRGCKIIAEGTAERPIVFTSAKAAGARTAGNWGGLLILGKAKVNTPGGEATIEGGIDATLGKYGGTDDADNSGILKYVRIEYAGIAFQPNNETNSLTLGAVGSGTNIEYVMCNRGGDDAFEWFGGTVSGKYLIAANTVDDMFDTDFGYTGSNQFVLGVSDPLVADISGSNGFESDNDASGTLNIPITKALFSNVTILGPLQRGVATIEPNFKRAMHIRRSSKTNVVNSILTGFPIGLRADGVNTVASLLTTKDLILRGNIYAGMTTKVESDQTALATNIATEYSTSGTELANVTDVKFADVAKNDFRLATGSPALTGADFTGYTGFTSTTYRGAFDSSSNWTACWATFDPQNEDYSKAINYFSSKPSEFTYTQVKPGSTDLQFTAPTGTNYTYLWTFADGTTSTAANPVKATSGDVKLTVYNERGCAANITKRIATGVEEIKELKMLSVYPNPATDLVTIDFSLTEAKTIQMSIFDLAGKQLSSQKETYTAGDNKIVLNTSNFNNGFYLVRLSAENGQKTIKLSVLR